ncbi:MAG TPA: hypothetical protein VIC26_01805 [Marinagarivorans sp.]
MIFTSLVRLLASVRAPVVVACVLVFIGVGRNEVMAQGSSAPPALLERVLTKADDAYLAKRYTQPKHNNAHDRYRAVLMIDPDNKRALMGLQRVEEAYVALIESALNSGNLQSAKSLLAVLAEYYPRSKQLAPLRKRLAQAVPAPLPSPDVSDLLVKEYPLNPRDLSARNAQARALVADIAMRVSNSKEAVLILARNDSEGRWIYQIMNEATPEYRVRGDIQLRNRPAIHLLEPL